MNDYFASIASELDTSSAADSSNTQDATAAAAANAVDNEPHRVRVLSWNIDGLDNNSISLRTKAVCQIIDKWGNALELDKTRVYYAPHPRGALSIPRSILLSICLSHCATA